MKTKALRLYGKMDLRLEDFELPAIKPDELLVRIVSDSACMSSYKASVQGAAHKRVPDDVLTNPVVIGHEFCGEIVEPGAALANEYKRGMRFTLQPAMKGTYEAAGYSFKHLGGDMQYAIIPSCYIEQGNVLKYDGDGWFKGSVAEPLSCVIGAAHANYHTSAGDYVHRMGIKQGGLCAVLAGAGPMGLAMIDYLVHCDRRPSLLVVTDIDDARLNRAAKAVDPADAAARGVELKYVNASGKNAVAELLAIASGALGRACDSSAGAPLAGGSGGAGLYDDVFVFAPVAPVVEQADALLGHDGCLNFFAGPSDAAFAARLNFYNVHYNATHIAGTSGGNTDDMREALAMAAEGRINPAILVTHVGGLDAARETTLGLPKIPGGKKLIYTHISMPLTAIDDFARLGQTDPLFAELSRITAANRGMWSVEAEAALLAGAKRLA